MTGQRIPIRVAYTLTELGPTDSHWIGLVASPTNINESFRTEDKRDKPFDIGV